MKKTFLTIVVAIGIAISSQAISQTIVKMDTMITTKNTNLIGKITKVSETEIEYKKIYEPDAPVYTVNKDKIKEIRWGNGTVERVVPDEMGVNKELEIIDKRSTIKFNFFSPVNDQIKFSYEHSVKVGTNIEIAAGLINNSMLKSSFNYGKQLTQGGTLSVGVKFLLGQDYYIKGMKYTHPLKGWFIKPEIAYSGYTVRGIQIYNWTPYNSSLLYTDRKINSIALLINYGRQFILGNVLTLSYSVGLGYSYVDSKFSNPAVVASNYYNSDYNNPPTNLYTHLRAGSVPIAFNGALTIGYIFK